MKGIHFYYYHNWKAGQQNKIHKGHCKHCRFGFGKHVDAKRGQNGVWIGPFKNVSILRKYLSGFLPSKMDAPLCDHCK